MIGKKERKKNGVLGKWKKPERTKQARRETRWSGAQ